MNTKPVLNFSLGKIIRLRRVSKGMKQETLAELADIDVSYISEIETGKRNPTYNVLYHLARALDTYPSEISKEVELDVYDKLEKHS
ncbi:Helix-turn-helix [Evansella caseinilytica]|uniref:Helix-turn-helix n=1 Tax=Evansella caseinilytica TaxID=1503961 RepID=A0A1H3UFL9_9BACI|nr:helix-turn-helix transcriptional regulator [Evansella caseinilytica]SDZ61240.1 Helix-turn-helix [Evansella caseinilytica]